MEEIEETEGIMALQKQDSEIYNLIQKEKRDKMMVWN
jgi:hypothetical protein